MLSITRQANIDQSILHLCSATPWILFPGLEPPKQAAHSKDRTCPKVLHKGHSRIENSTLQEQTSKTRTPDTRTPTPHARFMPLSQNITRIHSLHHPQISRFHVISHTWSYPPSTSRKMLHHSQAPFPHQSHRETLELSAPRYYQLHNP